MARPDKAAAVAQLTESFRDSTAAVLTEYRGLTVAELKELRRSLHGTATYSVVKNTLTKIAAKAAGFDSFEALLEGPSAIAFITGDPVEAAKGLRSFGREHPHLVVKGGVVDGKALTGDEIRRLADLESREVLLAKFAGGLAAPAQQLVNVLAAPAAQLARLLGALEAKLAADPDAVGGDGASATDPAAAEPPVNAEPEAADEAPQTDEAPAVDAPATAEAPAADGADAAPETTDETDAEASAAAEASDEPSDAAADAAADPEPSPDSTTEQTPTDGVADTSTES